jgi:hypothetical protein
MKSNLQTARTWVCDHAGFYNTFHVSDVIAWLNGGEGVTPQAIRDAIRGMVKTGVMTRTGRGQYAWVDRAGD